MKVSGSGEVGAQTLQSVPCDAVVHELDSNPLVRSQLGPQEGVHNNRDVRQVLTFEQHYGLWVCVVKEGLGLLLGRLGCGGLRVP